MTEQHIAVLLQQCVTRLRSIRHREELGGRERYSLFEDAIPLGRQALKN
jgi:hypothetical protein